MGNAVLSFTIALEPLEITFDGGFISLKGKSSFLEMLPVSFSVVDFC